MKNIALIPIDNRPVCYQLPTQIANLDKQYKLFLPDIKLLGDLTKNADYKGILLWLNSLKDIDIVVLSLDTIAYGGLIPSRRSNDSIKEVKNRILELKEILERKQCKVYAFSSIMRISNNNYNEEEKEYWIEFGKKIFEYSYNLHKTGNTKTDIPESILEDYLLTRKRNFEINKFYIELKKEGLFDCLVFSKDDCAEFGLNVKEAQELAKLSQTEENIFIKTGADEIPLTLLSRALNKDKKIKIAPIYTNPETIDKISKYEDISVDKSVKSQIELSGAIVSDVENCDLVIYVNNFKNQQGELVMDVYEPLFDGEINIPQKPYFIVDILNANGSDNNFVSKFLEKSNMDEFFGYSAWNTTGNSLGSALACALTLFKAKIPNEKAFLKLQLTRFLDDWAYQANIRGKIRNNKDNLSNGIIKNEMKKYEEILQKKFAYQIANIEYNFPWNRFFEIELKILP